MILCSDLIQDLKNYFILKQYKQKSGVYYSIMMESLIQLGLFTSFFEHINMIFA